MLKVLAGELSATFNIDGQHLDRYVGRQTSVVKSLCDQLLLHDQILIPTQDYLTAAGYARLTDKEILKAYIDVLHQTPWIQGTSGRVLRIVASLGLGALGLGWVVDAAASAVDSFVVDKVVRGKGAKFFIESLRKFSGRIRSSH